MNKIEICNVKKGNERTLAYIQTESWKAAFGEILSPETLKKYTDIDKITDMYKEIIESNPAKGILLTVDGVPHGIAFWGRCREADNTDSAELICIHSLCDKWNKGFGSILMNHVLVEIKEAGYKEVVLWVFKKNIRARKFYEKHGFKLTNHCKEFCCETEVMYAKQL